MRPSRKVQLTAALVAVVLIAVAGCKQKASADALQVTYFFLPG